MEDRKGIIEKLKEMGAIDEQGYIEAQINGKKFKIDQQLLESMTPEQIKEYVANYPEPEEKNEE